MMMLTHASCARLHFEIVTERLLSKCRDIWLRSKSTQRSYCTESVTADSSNGIEAMFIVARCSFCHGIYFSSKMLVSQSLCQ